MDAVKFLQERKRMYESGTPTPSIRVDDDYDPVRAVKVVEEWSSAHPRKTRQDVFLEQWPEARIDKAGILEIFPCAVCATLRNKRECCTSDFSCIDCRREFWMQEVA